MRKIISLAAIAMLASTVAYAAPVKHALKGANLAPSAKVTLAVARSTALAARPGVITDQELEKEKGGTGLRYSFDIKSDGKTFEVGVDARTGKVLENAAEGANPD
ncbi:MAG: peptidase M4 [Sphingomonas sp. 28-66-16]|nr:MAG: peptidase M4 [Sphingomonas sp. 28-66-16]